jgi:hypothetical protein
MRRRLVRALTWGVIVGVGIAAGLLAGSVLADVPLDGKLLTQTAVVVGVAAALAGLLFPVRRAGPP